MLYVSDTPVFFSFQRGKMAQSDSEDEQTETKAAPESTAAAEETSETKDESGGGSSDAWTFTRGSDPRPESSFETGWIDNGAKDSYKTPSIIEVPMLTTGNGDITMEISYDGSPEWEDLGTRKAIFDLTASSSEQVPVFGSDKDAETEGYILQPGIGLLEHRRAEVIVKWSVAPNVCSRYRLRMKSDAPMMISGNPVVTLRGATDGAIGTE